MRYYLFTLVASVALAQSTAVNYQTDLNGRLVEGNRLQVGAKGDRTELSDSINGRKVPREVTETRVLSESPTGRVVETITRKFDPTGQPSTAVRTVSEEQTRGNATTIRATTYVSDVNGRFQEGERRTVESVKQGTTTSSEVTSQVTIARPGPSGSFDTIEKRTVVSVKDKDKLHEDETVYRPAQNSAFVPAEHEVRDSRTEGGVQSTTIQNYKPDYTGKMELMTQEVSKTTQKSDGSSITERNVYARTSDGVAVTGDNAQRVRAQEIVVRTKGPGDAVIEVTNLRQTSPGDTNRLGEPRKVSETVCVGKCDAALKP